MPKATLKNRRKYVERMIGQGLSVYDIARYFQVPPSAIRSSISQLNISEEQEIPQITHGMIDAVLQKRDELLAKELQYGELSEQEVLRSYGFIRLPLAEQFASYADNYLREHSTGPEYDALFFGLSAREAGAKLGITAQVFNQRIKW